MDGLDGFRVLGHFVKNEFGHDLIRNDISLEVKCLLCKKVFSFYDINNEGKNILREPCPKKVNDQLKINREREMMDMLSKYFCIWKV